MDAKHVIEAITAAKKLGIPRSVSAALSSTASKISSLPKGDFLEEGLYAGSVHILKNQGKLIRPGLLLSSAYLLGKNPADFVDLAVAIELLHSSSLVHDDIIDKDTTRRGVQAVHMKYGTEKAILAGDALIAKAISLVSKYGERVVDRASEAAMAMCAGEVLDIEQQSSKNVPGLDAYLRIAQLKTATLIAISCSIVADYYNDDRRDLLYSVGFNMGLSFQIRDDIMNFVGAKDMAPKSTGNDVKNNRPNIVSVFEASGKPDPLKTAIKLGNFYTETAEGLLRQIGSPEIFIGYLDSIRI